MRLESDSSDEEPPNGGADIAGRLERHLASLGCEFNVVNWRILAGGRSSQTILMDVDSGGDRRSIVCQLSAETGPLAGIADLTRQFEILSALSKSDVPVAAPLHLCTDPTPLGRPFILTDFVEGSVADPWRPSGREFVRKWRDSDELKDGIVRALIGIHEVGEHSLPDSARTHPGRNSARFELDRWSQILSRSRMFRDDPVLVYAQRWLDACEPEQDRRTLVHGDFRVGNLVMNPSGVSAVLDWEFAEVGNPLLDIALLNTPPMMVEGRYDGIWEDDEFLRRYEALSGRTIDRGAYAYFRVLATFKVASVWVNASFPYEDGSDDLAELRAGFSVLHLRRTLAEVMGLPEAPQMPVSPHSTQRVTRILGDAARFLASSVTDTEARERAAGLIAVLRELHRIDGEGAAMAEFEADVAGAVMRYAAAHRDFTDPPGVPAHERLTAVVRHQFDSPSTRDVTGEEIRALLTRAAQLTLRMWP